MAGADSWGKAEWAHLFREPLYSPSSLHVTALHPRRTRRSPDLDVGASCNAASKFCSLEGHVWYYSLLTQ